MAFSFRLALSILPLLALGCGAAPAGDPEAASSGEALTALTKDGLSLGPWSSNAAVTATDGAGAPLAWSAWAGAPFRLEADVYGAALRSAALVSSTDGWRTRSRVACTLAMPAATGASPAPLQRLACTLPKASSGTAPFFVELVTRSGNTTYAPGNYQNYTVEGRTDAFAPYFTDSFNTAIGGSTSDRDRAESTRVARVSTNGQPAGAGGSFVLWSAANPKRVCVRAGQTVPVRVDARDLESGVGAVELHASRDGWRTKTVTAMKAVEERQPGWYYAQVGYEAALPALAAGATVEATVVARDASGRERWLTDFGKNVVVTTTCAP